jgi:hypothetical protein
VKKKKKSHARWYEARHDIAVFAIPLLKKLSKKHMTHPFHMTSEEWKSTLEEIIYSLECIVNFDDIELTKEQYQKRQIGLQLFGIYFHNLWD